MAPKPDPPKRELLEPHRLNTHHLIALMSYTIGGAQDDSPRRLDLASVNLKNGFSDEPQTNLDTCTLLDALASICVSNEVSQVVAIAMQVSSQEQKIKLIIAENDDVSRKQIAYLTSVWEKLKDLSHLYAVRREEESSKDPIQPLEMLQQPKATLPLRTAIFAEIYAYSIKKQIKRVHKWWRGLVVFLNKLSTLRGEDPEEGIEQDLCQVCSEFHAIFKVVRELQIPGTKLTQAQWEFVYQHSIRANQQARLVLANMNWHGCELLVGELKEENKFRLRRALEKLTSLPRNIEVLFKLAHSPDFFPYLQYSLSIFPAPGESYTVMLPGGQASWEFLLASASKEYLGWQVQEAKILAKRFRKKKNRCKVHCECGLVKYLINRHNDSWDNIPAFNYLGVSKLSCSACRIWLESFNQGSESKFYTKGSHGKYYWPWGMPTVEVPLGEVMAEGPSQESMPKRPLKETMSEKLAEEYVTYKTKKKKKHDARSDSTDPSLYTTTEYLDDTEAASINATRAKPKFPDTTHYNRDPFELDTSAKQS